MGDGSDEAGGGGLGKLGVGVEGDDVSDTVEDCKRADFDGEAVELVEEEFIEIEEFASFALPTHPYSLAGVEDSIAM